MATPGGGFEVWLDKRLEELEVDKDVYASYIHGVLQEEENEEEKLDALQSILSAFLEEDSLLNVCKEIIMKWSDDITIHGSKGKNAQEEDEVQAIANMIEKQAQIVVKQKEVTEEEKQRKAALLAQYANVTDEEDEGDEEEGAAASASLVNHNKSLFKNTNVEDVMNARKLEREKVKEEAQKKKEQDKLQREKDKLAKQERKEKEKKRTQKGERKR
ncbi:coiled-coil domain-containing protein 43 [Latimeria chalumnae]|uniref:Coiled-coil domain-containing protein 43 n=1 Tax=Latimeria chalumnae TaxID=7897 RepID=H3B164_LATCH|nr:PREDICTED: coiled-coil domain-containing protein 43 [Latimeria chalumnae]|eukprot:XP_006000220.1 PREDICTED: coiled-coil domain-containing protein 43 [Latimeria chalumnae]